MSDLPDSYRACVGIMIINNQGLIWTGHRFPLSETPTTGSLWWQMPQGGIEDGESLHQAAYRELFEETGITTARIIAETAGTYCYDLPPRLIPKAWNGRYRGQRQRWVAMRFSGDDDEITISPPEGSHHEAEFYAWRWSSHTELPDIAAPFKRKIYEQVLAEFAHLIAA